MPTRLLAVFALLCGLFPRAALGAVGLLDANGWKVQLGGFAQLDLMVDSTRDLTETPGNNPISLGGSYAGDNGRTQMSVRNSRLSFNVMAPPVDEWKTRAYFEGDFLGFDPTPGGATTNSEASFFTAPTFRERHIYLQAEKNGLTLTVGQFWTLFGWQMQYIGSTVSAPPVAGMMYLRQPQITAVKSFPMGDRDKVEAGLSIVRPAQRDSTYPTVDGALRLVLGGRRAAYTMYNGDRKAEPMSLGVSGTVRALETPVAGSTSQRNVFAGYAGAVDVLIPILASSDEKDTSGTLALVGEGTLGTGYGEEFNSWTGGIAQTSNGTKAPATATGTNLDGGLGGFDTSGFFHTMDLHSLMLSLQYHLPQGWDTFVTLGYGRLASGNIATLVGGTMSRAETLWANVFHDFSPQVRLGVEYGYYQSLYVSGASAHMHRGQVSAWFRL